jgi:hypothetical protein
MDSILHGMYDREYMASLTMSAGDNTAKLPLDCNVLLAITVKQRFGNKPTDGEIKWAISQKCLNSVKRLTLNSDMH